MEDWKRILWTDETKINCLGSDRRKRAWKEVGEPSSDKLVESTVKFGDGNMMIWGCIFWEGIGYATRIEGKMDAELYCSILDDELQQFLDHYNKSPSNITFHQNNDLKHRSQWAEK
jgi:hypothetical protein